MRGIDKTSFFAYMSSHNKLYHSQILPLSFQIFQSDALSQVASAHSSICTIPSVQKKPSPPPIHNNFTAKPLSHSKCAFPFTSTFPASLLNHSPTNPL